MSSQFKSLMITSKNIGRIRRLLMVPWSSRWNAYVRDWTARREHA